MASVVFPCGSGAESAGINPDIDFVLSHRARYRIAAERVADSVQEVPTELGALFAGAIRAYQLLISTQDSPACRFTPSCSNFTMMSVHRSGIIRGSLLGADRLMRCHWFSSCQLYPDCGIETGTGRIPDPVEFYLGND